MLFLMYYTAIKELRLQWQTSEYYFCSLSLMEVCGHSMKTLVLKLTLFLGRDMHYLLWFFVVFPFG